MKLSIVIAVLESYEVVRRQILHFQKMQLPLDIEIIILDDGSTPPIRTKIGSINHQNGVSKTGNIFMIETNDPRPWSQPCARNTGAKMAAGEYLLFTDIDHVLSKEAIMTAKEGGYDKMVFHRHWGVLQKDGSITQDIEILFDYGLPEKIYAERGLHGGMHPNTFAMPAKVFKRLKGYDPRYCGRYGGDDVDFSKRYGHLCRKLGEVKPHVLGPPIWVYPQAREDVKRVFHQTRFTIGRIDRIDPVCDNCKEMYRNCFCYYPKKESSNESTTVCSGQNPAPS